jgi:hypothetical protein
MVFLLLLNFEHGLQRICDSTIHSTLFLHKTVHFARLSSPWIPSASVTYSCDSHPPSLDIVFHVWQELKQLEPQRAIARSATKRYEGVTRESADLICGECLAIRIFSGEELFRHWRLSFQGTCRT